MKHKSRIVKMAPILTFLGLKTYRLLIVGFIWYLDGRVEFCGVRHSIGSIDGCYVTLITDNGSLNLYHKK